MCIALSSSSRDQIQQGKTAREMIHYEKPKGGDKAFRQVDLLLYPGINAG